MIILSSLCAGAYAGSASSAGSDGDGVEVVKNVIGKAAVVAELRLLGWSFAWLVGCLVD